MHAHLLFLTQRQFPGPSHRNSINLHSAGRAALSRPCFCSNTVLSLTRLCDHDLITTRRLTDTRHTTAALCIAPRTPKNVYNEDMHADHEVLTASWNTQQLKLSLDRTGPSHSQLQVLVTPSWNFTVEGGVMSTSAHRRSPFRRTTP